MAAAPAPASVVSSWKDAKGNFTQLRQGTYDSASKNGFGWKKINNKHGITKYQTVKHPTGNPAGPKYKGTKREYVAYATRWVNKKAVEQIPVYTIVESASFNAYYGVKLGNNPPGVLTTYCANPNKAEKCPTWVDTAFSAANNKRSIAPETSPEEDGSEDVSYSWSYTPEAVE